MIDPDRWRVVSPYLDQALEMSDGDRAAWLASVRGQNPALATQLESLRKEAGAVAELGKKASE